MFMIMKDKLTEIVRNVIYIIVKHMGLLKVAKTTVIT